MRPVLITLAASLLVLSYGSAKAEQFIMNLPPGNYARAIGKNHLKDPAGISHSAEEIKGKVVVAIFDTPNIKKGSPDRWGQLLAQNPKTKLPASVFLVRVENIAAAGGFSKMPLTAVKSSFIKGQRPLTLLDDEGKVSKRFGVAPGSTQIYIFGKDGKLKDVERDLSNESLTLRRIRAVVATLEKE